MGYSPSPRPTFDGPAHIPYESVTRHLWGDPVSGEVADWIYVSSEKIHQLVYGLTPGRMFGHSDAFRTIFAADVVYYVLSGCLAIANPATGEVQRVLPGEAAFFRRDTWHHALNCGTEPLRVLEFFAPPPAKGTSGAYARQQPYLNNVRYTQDQWLGQWPAAQQEADRERTIQAVRESDVLWRLEGEEHLTLVGILMSTEHLTVGTITLLPGQQTDVHTHGGDEGLYLREGTLNVRVPEHNGVRWHELKAGDGFYIPQGEPHQYYNISGQPATLVFGVAPDYLPRASDT
jgi:quercetin dioxygenase-like cupin family protein